MNAIAIREDNIDRYISEIQRYPLLSREDEVSLAKRLRDHGDVSAAHQLVVSNLRFVVKVAHEYKGYGLKITDLIQEGNVGLMLAVKKFDPDKGYRLISYAVWWIRAQIRSFISRSWSMVKIGTTFTQRKLFFSMRKTRARLEQLNNGTAPTPEELAEALGVEVAELADMESRMAARDFSLDATLGEDSHATHLDQLPTANDTQEVQLVDAEQRHLLRGTVAEAMETLNEKERYIVESRLLNDEPKTLQEIGDEFNVSRERVRQLETRVLKKLRTAIEASNNAA